MSAAAAPVLVLVNGDAAKWRPAVESRGWRLEAASALPSRPAGEAYLAGDAASVLYFASLAPDWWQAAVAIGGPAIGDKPLFGRNTQLVPVLWVGANAGEMERLKAAQFQIEVRPQATVEQALEWLGAHRREPLAASVDCETADPAHASCYWLEITKFDPAQRNDVLDSSRVATGSGAMLALRLQPGDRIVAIGGTAVANDADVRRYLDGVKEEKPVAVIVQRGKDRIRVETRAAVPKRGDTFSARLQGVYTAEERQLQILSRGAGELRLHLPAEWSGAAVNWNGSEIGKLETGCWVLSVAGAAACGGG